MFLEEALRIEEKEAQLQKKLEFHRENAIKEADLRARKEQENAAQLLETQNEERERHDTVTRMVVNSDKSLAPITNVLANFEGKVLSFFQLFFYIF